MHAIRTYIFYQSLNRLQHGLSAIAELLVIFTMQLIFLVFSDISVEKSVQCVCINVIRSSMEPASERHRRAVTNNESSVDAAAGG